ncbi:hypothetical protein PV646_34180 [Streptomyces sp. ID05-26A]|nr:hypothetical protein [Streptomyces sp. ID05-26A]
MTAAWSAFPELLELVMDDHHTTSEALRCRRAASWRLPVLAHGRRDPLDPHPEDEPMLPAATAAAILHLRALGLGAWIPVQDADLRQMWQAGGKCQRLAVEQAELNARWSA